MSVDLLGVSSGNSGVLLFIETLIMKRLALPILASLIAISPSLKAMDSDFDGSLRYGLAFDDGGIALQNFGSRFVYQASHALPSGLTITGDVELRLRNERFGNVFAETYGIGIEGAWGKVTIGVVDTAQGLLIDNDIAWKSEEFGFLRTDIQTIGGIRFDRDLGNIEISAGARLVDDGAGSENFDMIDFGLLYKDVNFSAGMVFVSGDQNTFGGEGTSVILQGSYSVGGMNIQGTHSTAEEGFFPDAVDLSYTNVKVDFGRSYAWLGIESPDGFDDRQSIGVGHRQIISDQVMIRYEVHSTDDGDDSELNIDAALIYHF